MKKSKMSVVLGTILSAIGLLMTIINGVLVYEICSGYWTPLNKEGVARGAGLNIALLCSGVVVLVIGIASIVIDKKKNK